MTQDNIEENASLKSNLRKAFIFDFDETLVTTDSKVTVKHSNGQTTTLTPSEFNSFVVNEGDLFDYSDFDNVVNPESLPLMSLVRQLNSEGHPVFVITARGLKARNPIVRYLESQGVVLHEIYCVGSDTGKVNIEQEKRKILLTIMESFDRIYFYEDNIKILNHISDLEKTKTYRVVKNNVNQ